MLLLLFGACGYFDEGEEKDQRRATKP